VDRETHWVTRTLTTFAAQGRGIRVPGKAPPPPVAGLTTPYAPTGESSPVAVTGRMRGWPAGRRALSGVTREAPQKSAASISGPRQPGARRVAPFVPSFAPFVMNLRLVPPPPRRSSMPKRKRPPDRSGGRLCLWCLAVPRSRSERPRRER
jgi:hypothetical protein